MAFDRFIPDYIAGAFSKIDFEKLAAGGVKAVILDADNTLLPYDEDRPGPEIREICAQLVSEGLYVCILSNGHSARVKSIAEELDLDFIGDALKPLKKGFEVSAGRSGVPLANTLVVGDQIFTDVWGARRTGCVSVLVTPVKLSGEPVFVRMKRIAEKAFRKRIAAEAVNIERRD